MLTELNKKMENLFSKDFKEITLKPIHQVAEELKIEPYILRFWETRFPQISPTKGKGNRRLYNSDDIAIIKKIKHLLYDEGFTIEGAKRTLSEETETTDKSSAINKIIKELQDIKLELESI